MNRTSVTLLASAAIVTLSGCASMGSTTAAGQPSATAVAVAASPSAPPCTSHTCIAHAIQGALVGLVAKDDAVITKAECWPLTVTGSSAVWTVTCRVTESDGSVSSGDANLVPSSGTVTWNPQKIISGGS